jgi:outer membrane protein assembly factor BamB
LQDQPSPFARRRALNSTNVEFSQCGLLLLVCLLPLVSWGCAGKAFETPAAALPLAPKPPTAVPMWLGNAERNFYGTGPWTGRPLKVVWEVETGWISGRLHKDPWGGTSWPGQASIRDDRVFFPSADGNVYCLNKKDGSVIWKFKGKDSQKATPVIFEEKIIASGIDHHIYCLNARDGSLIWDYETGFEVDGSTVVTDGRVYFGAEDRNFYCLNLADGALIYKVPVGSVEGSITMKDGRIYLGTEQGELYCLDPADGRTVWKSKIGADSDSTPAVVNGFVYTAAEDGVVRSYKQETGELVWKFATDGARKGGKSELIGIWASPIYVNGRVHIGASDGYLYCLTADKGELVWKYKARGPIWGTSPVVEGRVIFGDKAGWVHMISAADGTLVSEIKIGDNINATPAILDGRIYVGAFNGKLYCLSESEPGDEKAVAIVPPAQTPAPVRSRSKFRRARQHPKTPSAPPITPAIP